MAKKITPKTSGDETPPGEDDTRTRAYHIWEGEGRPDGRAEDHWRQAEADLRNPLYRGKTAPTPAEADEKATRKRRAAARGP